MCQRYADAANSFIIAGLIFGLYEFEYPLGFSIRPLAFIALRPKIKQNICYFWGAWVMKHSRDNYETREMAPSVMLF